MRHAHVLSGRVRLKITIDPRGGATFEPRGDGLRMRCADHDDLDLQLWAGTALNGPETIVDLKSGDRLDSAPLGRRAFPSSSRRAGRTVDGDPQGLAAVGRAGEI